MILDMHFVSAALEVTLIEMLQVLRTVAFILKILSTITFPGMVAIDVRLRVPDKKSGKNLGLDIIFPTLRFATLVMCTVLRAGMVSVSIGTSAKTTS